MRKIMGFILLMLGSGVFAADGAATASAQAKAAVGTEVKVAPAVQVNAAVPGVQATVQATVQVTAPAPLPTSGPTVPPAVAPAGEALQYAPRCKLAVLDFMITDLAAEKYLHFTEKKDTAKPQETLNDADRKSIDPVMQGFVRMIDAEDEHQARANRRDRLNMTNDREWAKRDHWRALLTLTAQGRSAVVASDLLAAYLGEHRDLFTVVDRKNIEDLLRETSVGRSGTVDANSVALVQKMTGATHFVYGIVMDLAREDQKFSGYGIKTDNICYRVEVLVKIVDIRTMEVVFSRTFTGSMTELRTAFAQYENSALFNDLMKMALQQADSAIYEDFKKQGPQTPSVSFALSVNPAGDGDHFDPRDAEIYIDGVFKANAPAKVAITPGRHVVEIKMNGYETKRYDMVVNGGETLTPKLVKINRAPAF